MIVTSKGIVSRDFGGLIMIDMDRTWVPAILMKVYFLNLRYYIVFY